MAHFCLLLILPLLVKCAPLYPLFSIDSEASTYVPTTSDYQVIATNFTAIQLGSGPGGSALDGYRKVNPNFKIVKYINSHSTTSAVYWAEQYRIQLAYFITGQLLTNINSTQTTFNLSHIYNLLPSTASGDYSDTKNSGSIYVTWIRIDNELMKLITVTNKANNISEITVKRGLDSTPMVSHNLNSNIFTPGYNSPNSPGKGNILNYLLDPGTSASLTWLVDNTTQHINAGFDGSWYDCFESQLFQSCAMDGTDITGGLPWDFHSNMYYNNTSFLNAQQPRLTNDIKQVTANLNGKIPYILANNMNSQHYWATSGNTRKLLISDPNNGFPTPLNGYCIESFAGSLNGTCEEPDFEGYNPESKWLSNVQELMDAAQNNLAAFPMIANAGCKSVAIEEMSPTDRDAFESWAYASYLLAIEKPSGATRLGVPAYYRDNNNNRYAYVHPRYSWNIGLPKETYAYDQVKNYIPNGHITYRRVFENGAILVNPSLTTDQAVPLPSGVVYIDNSVNPPAKISNNITVKGQTGKILLVE